MYGSWIYFAIANFIFIAIALIWGMSAQLSSRSTTFAAKRQNIFEEYSHRKMKELLSFRATDAPQASALRRTFLKPFNSQDAFFSHLPSWSPVCWVSWVSSTSSSSPFRCGVRRNLSECVGMCRKSKPRAESECFFPLCFNIWCFNMFQFCSSPW